jgi:succinate dehydrogenase / fumarate reductase cytochrome b subunit
VSLQAAKITVLKEVSAMKRAAPLSPFWNYRWSRTFFNPSIIQRYTAFVLIVGLIMLVYFLWAVAAGAHSYARAAKLFAHPLFRAFLVILTWSFIYHLLAGIRHLILDAGYGLERNAARGSGIAVIVAVTVLTAAALLLSLFKH